MPDIAEWAGKAHIVRERGGSTACFVCDSQALQPLGRLAGSEWLKCEDCGWKQPKDEGEDDE